MHSCMLINMHVLESKSHLVHTSLDNNRPLLYLFLYISALVPSWCRMVALFAWHKISRRCKLRRPMLCQRRSSLTNQSWAPRPQLSDPSCKLLHCWFMVAMISSFLRHAETGNNLTDPPRPLAPFLVTKVPPPTSHGPTIVVLGSSCIRSGNQMDLYWLTVTYQPGLLSSRTPWCLSGDQRWAILLRGATCWGWM